MVVERKVIMQKRKTNFFYIEPSDNEGNPIFIEDNDYFNQIMYLLPFLCEKDELPRKIKEYFDIDITGEEEELQTAYTFHAKMKGDPTFTAADFPKGFQESNTSLFSKILETGAQDVGGAGAGGGPGGGSQSSISDNIKRALTKFRIRTRYVFPEDPAELERQSASYESHRIRAEKTAANQARDEQFWKAEMEANFESEKAESQKKEEKLL